MRKMWIGLALALLATGCGSTAAPVAKDAPTKAASHTRDAFSVTGSLTIADTTAIASSGDYVGAPCDGTDGYDDLTSDAQVVVKNAAGAKIALGKLGPGNLDDKVGSPDATCTFTLLVFDVPTQNRDLYSLQVGHRDDYTFTKKDAESGLSLTIG